MQYLHVFGYTSPTIIDKGLLLILIYLRAIMRYPDNNVVFVGFVTNIKTLLKAKLSKPVLLR